MSAMVQINKLVQHNELYSTKILRYVVAVINSIWVMSANDTNVRRFSYNKNLFSFINTYLGGNKSEHNLEEISAKMHFELNSAMEVYKSHRESVCVFPSISHLGDYINKTLTWNLYNGLFRQYISGSFSLHLTELDINSLMSPFDNDSERVFNFMEAAIIAIGERAPSQSRIIEELRPEYFDSIVVDVKEYLEYLLEGTIEGLTQENLYKFIENGVLGVGMGSTPIRQIACINLYLAMHIAMAKAYKIM